MELKEMIKVMEHFEKGGVVEFSENNFKTILDTANKNDGDLSWDWDTFKYRIKEPKQKVTIEKWLCRSNFGSFVILECSNINMVEGFAKVKLIETYEVEL